MKAPYLAIVLVIASVAGVVALGGVTNQRGEKVAPIATAKPEAAPATEAPPFPPLAGPVWNLTSVDARIAIPEGWSKIGRAHV